MGEKNQTLENFDPLDMTYGSRDEKGPSSAERRIHRDLMREEGGNNPNVAVVAEVV